MLLIILILMTIIQTGCWNARELNALGIALVMGIDVEGEDILLTAEIIEPTPAKTETSKNKSEAVRYVQGRGLNMYEAFRDITLKFDRRVFIAHNKVIILGEDFIKNRSINDIDLLARDFEQRETAYLLVAKGAKAYEVMGINTGLEEIPGNYILKLIENHKYNPKTMNITLVEFFKYFYGLEKQPILGVIERKDRKKIDKFEGEAKSKEYELSTIGSAVFYEDSLIGYLNGNDTKGVNFINGNIKHGIVTFPTPTLQKVENHKKSQSVSGKKISNEHISTITIVRLKTKKDIEIIDGKPMLKVKIKLIGSVGEISGNIDRSTKEGINALEEACSKQIKMGIGQALKKVQREFKSDVFGFGSVFHRKYPKEWKKINQHWDEIFAEADFQIEVKTKAIRTGLINAPINIIKGK